MPNFYDTIVIGAGIAGSSIAYFLAQRGQEVLMVDRSDLPASGGSGAAGAFVSPKIGKGGPLQKLTNEAFAFAQEFYDHNFPQHFVQSGVARIPRDDVDANKFDQYAEHNYSIYERWSSDDLLRRNISDPNGAFFFPQAGDCDAPAMCRALLGGKEFEQFDVGSLSRKGDMWELRNKSSVSNGVRPADDSLLRNKSSANGVRPADDSLLRNKSSEVRPLGKNIVLATGYQNELFDMRYMGVKGLWGSRGDYISEIDIPVSLHKTISISSARDGIIKIGATHIKDPNPCMVCDGRPLRGLEEKASELVNMSDFVLKQTYCGMRSGSRDYFPLAGRVIDVEKMLGTYPNIVRGAKVEFEYLPNVFILNGLGGRGFVFAPLMAKWLSELMVEDKSMPESVNPDRLFYKWVRKLNKE